MKETAYPQELQGYFPFQAVLFELIDLYLNDSDFGMFACLEQDILGERTNLNMNPLIFFSCTRQKMIFSKKVMSSAPVPDGSWHTRTSGNFLPGAPCFLKVLDLGF